MGFSDKHIILKQVLELEYNGDADGFALQQEVSDWCHRELIPQIDEQLEKLGTKEKVYKIERLQIDVQLDAAGNWLANATTQLVQQLQDQVEQEIRKYHDNPALKPVSYAQQLEEAFIYFLQQGNLPWWSPVTSYQMWQEALEDLLMVGFSGKAREQLRQLLKQPDVQQRTLYQVPDALFIKLIVQVNAGIEKDVTNLINDIKHLVPDAAERKMVLAIFRQSVMVFIYEMRPQQFVEQVYAHFVHQLAAHSNPRYDQLSKGMWAGTGFKTTMPEEALRAKLHEQETDRIPLNGNIEAAKHAAGQKANPVSERSEPVKIKQDGIYIQNAGLVIVAPFLPVLFKKLGLLNDTVLTDMNRAVFIVQYIACGREQVAEFELGLAKILCGLELDTPVDTNIQLTMQEKNEVNELLLSVIEYWQVLKDTSPEALRETFLQRQGKLQFTNKQWLLQVEQKAWDMLLQHLPWNVSMLKLPWMGAMLRTEWY